MSSNIFPGNIVLLSALFRPARDEPRQRMFVQIEGMFRVDGRQTRIASHRLWPRELQVLCEIAHVQN